MSYNSHHLAWQQRVNKEHAKAKQFEDTYVPLGDNIDLPLKGLVEKYSSPYRFSDPNAMTKYDLKNTINGMEFMHKAKAKKLDDYRKSKSINMGSSFVGGSTLHSSSQAALSPYLSSKTKPAVIVEPNSPKCQELRTILAKANSTDVFTTDRYPKPKPFFQQAYLAKSKIDTLSQAPSRLSKSKSIGNFARAHYPPGHFKSQPNGGLPVIKRKERFNENNIKGNSIYSKRSSRRGSVNKLSIPKQYKNANLTFNKRKSVDGAHLSQVSNRAEELKRMLADTIQNMDDREVEVMENAIEKNAPSSGKKRRPGTRQRSIVGLEVKQEEADKPKDGELSEDRAENDEEEGTQHEEERQDVVDELPKYEDQASRVSKPAISSSKRSRRSRRSTSSTQYLSKLQSQIESERREREKLQKEMEEVKRINNELLSQLNSQKE